MRRLRWRCRRGSRELDALLVTYFEEKFSGLDETGKRLFERLLDFEDTELWRCLVGREPLEDRELSELVQKIRHFAAP
jgi:antitoxin CptB